MSLDSSVASEHLRDGADNISECMKTIKRVEKSFPELAALLSRASEHLVIARSSLKEAESSLLAGTAIEN